MRLVKYIGLCIILLCSCEQNTEQEITFDLFPFELGNNYYYSYGSYSAHPWPYSREYGTRTWTIVNLSSDGISNEYNFEEIYSNRMTLYYTINGEVRDTVFPDNDTIYFIVTENLESANLIYKDYSFNRYSSVRDTLYRFHLQSFTEVKFYLNADTGFTEIQYYYNSGNVTSSYTYILDSCNFIQN